MQPSSFLDSFVATMSYGLKKLLERFFDSATLRDRFSFDFLYVHLLEYTQERSLLYLHPVNCLHFANQQSSLGYVINWNFGESLKNGVGRSLLSARLLEITAQISPRSQECSHRLYRVDLDNTDTVDWARCRLR